MKNWLDKDGLVGSKPNPTPWSTGNPLLESAFAVALEVNLYGRDADLDFLKGISNAFGRCQNADGTFDKNPGRPDQITHDDIKALSAASRIAGMPYARAITKLGREKEWNLSNTGLPYWDAYAKPWDRAFYKMAASEVPSWDESFLYFFSIIIDGKFGDESSNRVTLLECLAVENVNPTIKIAFKIWRKFTRKRHTTVGDLNFAYYKTSHPYVSFGDKILI